MPKSRAPRPPQEPGFKRVVFCTGKVFYELHAERERLGLGEQIAIVRVEQLAPFPFDLVCREMYRWVCVFWGVGWVGGGGASGSAGARGRGCAVLAAPRRARVVAPFLRARAHTHTHLQTHTHTHRYPNAEVVWCQEEPMNMGAYYHVQPRMESCLRAEGRPTTGRITYAGRPPSASTATGFGQVHAQVGVA